MAAQVTNKQDNRNNLFLDIHKRLMMSPGLQGLNSVSKISDDVHSYRNGTNVDPLDSIRREAENIAVFIVKDALAEADRRPPNRYCKSMRKSVHELSERHDRLFNSMVKKLEITQQSAFYTFVNVADEVFMDGKINWGRIVVVYTFTAYFARWCSTNNLTDFPNKIALYTGKYVGNKLGHWICDNGGWESFADQFSDPAINSDSLWKGLLVTAALGTIGAVVAKR